MSGSHRPMRGRLEWHERAACAGHPRPDLWFSANLASRTVARQICADCPVRDACLAGALARGEEYGTWGGQDLDPPNEAPGRWAGRDRRAAS